MTIQGDKIVSITDIAGSGDGYMQEDSIYINRAADGTKKIKGIVAQILEKNGTDQIDIVSGATCSSNALIDACRQALESAKRPEEAK